MTTPLDALADALKAAAAHNPAAEAAPDAIVWCDATGDFASILPALRGRLPGLLTFGGYDIATRTGPALWLRAATVRQVPGVEWPVGEPPIIYLPGHARDVLRGAEDCPPELAPLVWFAVSGVFFGQPKQARDWTLRGFLAAQGSLVGLDLPEDAATRSALLRAAPRLFAEPIASLKGKRWDAAALDGLLVENPVADMLAWIDGALTREADPVRFDAFAGLATKQFGGFDPRKKTRQDAAARLVSKEKAWGKVWDRFAEANTGYNEVVRLLGFEEPQGDLLSVPDAYPAENTRREKALRAALLALDGKAASAAAKAIRDLEISHGWRRDTVWGKRGEARLAFVLAHLAVIADAGLLPAHDSTVMADTYATTGWKVDVAAMAALDLARNGEDRDAVIAALRALYLPWVDENATAMQALALADKVPFARPEQVAVPTASTAWLFVDGLRMDLAHGLAERLQTAGAAVTLGWRWSGFPTITATCKALASPAAGLLAAGPVEDLLPTFGGKGANKPVLVKAIEAAGWSCAETLIGDAPIWCEAGSFDEEGHALGAKLAAQVKDGIEEIAGVVLRLAKAGRRVRIVTDHGWLLMPGGLPHAALPAGLVVPSGKANRVATLKEGAATVYARLPWSWDEAVHLTTPPGARTFFNGTEYAHGGVSPQECVLPIIDVALANAAPPVALSVKWRNLMVKVRVEGGAGLMADVRLGADTSGVSALIKGPKALDDAGEANLGVDGDHEGQTVCVVVYRPETPHDIAAKLVTKAGG
ncbi:MAG TPA: BREX-1 system phosphatase PglZ type B [Roseomonas sp.]|nr:BREX-1 system phosphatase PglZ type B [Roseomonas sp.]